MTYYDRVVGELYLLIKMERVGKKQMFYVFLPLFSGSPRGFCFLIIIFKIIGKTGDLLNKSFYVLILLPKNKNVVWL